MLSGPKEAFFFAENFFKHPREVSSLIPSSRFLIRKIISNAEIHAAKLVVELGPGTGCVSRAILDKLPLGSKLLAMEINSTFSKFLEATIRDHRFTVINAQAQALSQTLEELGLGKADAIVSGIPF